MLGSGNLCHHTLGGVCHLWFSDSNHGLVHGAINSNGFVWTPHVVWVRYVHGNHLLKVDPLK